MGEHPRLAALRGAGIAPYASGSRRTLPLRDLPTFSDASPGAACGLPVGQGAAPVVAGRITSLSPLPTPGSEGDPSPSPTLRLQDGTGAAEFTASPGDPLLPHLALGDWIEGEIALTEGQPHPHLGPLTLLAPCLAPEPPSDGASLETLRDRGRILHGIRGFFIGRGFLEAETPTLSRHPGLEPHLDPFKTTYAPHPGAPGEDVYLLTSPEYAMKGLVVRGVERCFQISRVYRNGELGPFHNPEFTMLEWYRAFAGYVEIAQDLEDLILHLAAELGLGLGLSWGGRPVDLTPPFERLTVREAVARHCGFDLAGAMDAPSLARACGEIGVHIPPDTPWDEAFFRLLLERVEPHLGLERPTFLLDYPAPLAALARVRPGAFPVAERFELYIAGVEIGNAFTELSDPEAQAARFEEERGQRRALGAPDFEPDPTYLAALRAGLPPTGGIAVGVDRLVMVLTGAPDVRRTLAVPYPM